jgi:PIN domain nuclease of toxin-antitoxin system
MTYLLDTHTILWYLAGNNQLSRKAIDIIDSDSNSCMVSVVSLWEASIKVSLGKLSLKIKPSAMESVLNGFDITILPIASLHLSVLETLPFHHRDPFDRLIISQAIADNLTIISKDMNFPLYSANVLW